MNAHTYRPTWKTLRFASILQENATQNSFLEELNALQFRFGDIVPKKRFEIDEVLKETFKKYTIVEPNDIMINGLNLNYDFVTQRVAAVKQRGIITSAYISVRPRSDVNASYYCYLLKSLDAIKLFNGMGTGIRLTLSYSLLKNMKLPIPPRAEQDQIVRYLDWQVSKINKLIAAKKHQISVLRERETKLISSTICGIEEVPNSLKGALSSINANCKVANLSQLLNGIEQGWSPNAGEETNSSEQWHVLTLSAIKHGVFHAGANKPIDVAASVPQQLMLREGDLLMTRSNTRNLVGEVCIVDGIDEKTIFSDLIYRLLINEKMAVPKYIMYYLMSSLARHQIERAAKGSSGTMPKLSHTDIKKIRVILPSLESQEEIASRIDAITKSTELIISGITCSLTKLVEYRTRLISDVVTGQIDVRDVEIPDFEMAEESATGEDEPDEGEVLEEAKEQEE